jgi:hypothetical protein
MIKMKTMKRIFVSLLLILMLGVTVVFANDGNDVGDKIKESFKREFVGAESVSWRKLGDYQVATFVYKGSSIAAYFNTEGGLEATARYILFEELPLAVMKSLDKHFAGAEFNNILEVDNSEGDYYWLTVETAGKSYRVKSSRDGDMLRVNKKK